MTISVRVLVDEDADDYAALADAIEADHTTNFHLSAAEFLEVRREVGAVLEGAYDGDRLVAWSGYLPFPAHETGRPFLLAGDVHPAELGRGLGTLMAGRALAGARGRHAEESPQVRASFSIQGPSGRDDQADLLRGLGLEVSRYRFTMVAEGHPERAAFAPGYELVSFDAAHHELLCAAHNRAFADYPNHHPMAQETFDGFVVRAAHNRPELSWWLRDDTGAVAAYLFTQEYALPISGRRDGREAYIPYLGTLPAHRRRGLAGALIRHALHEHRHAGYATSSLEVDAANPTGALGLYERAGFAVVSRFDEYRLEDPA